MNTKELQTLVEQIGAHVSTLAQQQSTINKLLTEGIQKTGEQIQALSVIVQNHENRLNGNEGS